MIKILFTGLYYLDRLGGKEYALSARNQKAVVSEPQKLCHEDNAQLLVISSAEEDALATEILHRDDLVYE